MNLEQIALRVAGKRAFRQSGITGKWSFVGNSDNLQDDELIQYVKEVVAELTKGREPVLVIKDYKKAGAIARCVHTEYGETVSLPAGTELFATPPICPTDDYKARALMYEAANAEQGKLLNEVIAERDELRKDAERYRWVRKTKAAPCDYDSAIDAAIAKSKPDIPVKEM